ncbi:MAG: dTDP-4-dehydrorhamnose 3,5-epimerase [Candidatus Binataceae bacterium]
MKFVALELEGAFVIDPEPIADARGFFARSFCQREFAAHGLNPRVVQCNLSFNPKKGTLRGLHYQLSPAAETKLVRCTMGAIYDAIVDLRRDSSTYCQWFGLELTAQNRRMLYVPEGFGHGYLTLADDAEVSYQVSEFYAPGHERGARWNDPAFGIRWPMAPSIISDKDRGYSDFIP